MFTWECPKCGKELDVATTECPDCSGQTQPAGKSAPRAVAQEQPAAPSPSVESAKPPPAAPVSAPPAPPATLPEAPAARRRKAGGPTALGLEPSHLAILALILVMAVALAVFFARPEIFTRDETLRLEDVPAAQETGSAGTATLGDLQVAGIRTFYGDGYKLKVRAIVINHSESPKTGVDLEVHLSPPETGPREAPLASFVIQLKEELGPNESREVETDLAALGTLASLPRWDEVRINVELRSVASSAPGTGGAENAR